MYRALGIRSEEGYNLIYRYTNIHTCDDVPQGRCTYRIYGLLWVFVIIVFIIIIIVVIGQLTTAFLVCNMAGKRFFTLSLSLSHTLFLRFVRCRHVVDIIIIIPLYHYILCFDRSLWRPWYELRVKNRFSMTTRSYFLCPTEFFIITIIAIPATPTTALH